MKATCSPVKLAPVGDDSYFVICMPMAYNPWVKEQEEEIRREADSYFTEAAG